MQPRNGKQAYKADVFCHCDVVVVCFVKVGEHGNAGLE